MCFLTFPQGCFPTPLRGLDFLALCAIICSWVFMVKEGSEWLVCLT